MGFAKWALAVLAMSLSMGLGLANLELPVASIREIGNCEAPAGCDVRVAADAGSGSDLAVVVRSGTNTNGTLTVLRFSAGDESWSKVDELTGGVYDNLTVALRDSRLVVGFSAGGSKAEVWRFSGTALEPFRDFRAIDGPQVVIGNDGTIRVGVSRVSSNRFAIFEDNNVSPSETADFTLKSNSNLAPERMLSFLRDDILLLAGLSKNRFVYTLNVDGELAEAPFQPTNSGGTVVGDVDEADASADPGAGVDSIGLIAFARGTSVELIRLKKCASNGNCGAVPETVDLFADAPGFKALLSLRVVGASSVAVSYVDTDDNLFVRTRNFKNDRVDDSTLSNVGSGLVVDASRVVAVVDGALGVYVSVITDSPTTAPSQAPSQAPATLAPTLAPVEQEGDGVEQGAADNTTLIGIGAGAGAAGAVVAFALFYCRSRSRPKGKKDEGPGDLPQVAEVAGMPVVDAEDAPVLSATAVTVIDESAPWAKTLGRTRTPFFQRFFKSSTRSSPPQSDGDGDVPLEEPPQEREQALPPQLHTFQIEKPDL